MNRCCIHSTFVAVTLNNDSTTKLHLPEFVCPILLLSRLGILWDKSHRGPTNTEPLDHPSHDVPERDQGMSFCYPWLEKDLKEQRNTVAQSALRIF